MSGKQQVGAARDEANWQRVGPLAGIRVVEVAAVGPVSFVGMLLANLGAEVLRVMRPASSGGVSAVGADPLATGRPAVTIDLRSTDGRLALLGLCQHADVLVEGMRPGVMERLGVGPDECLRVNPRLVYGRVSGFGSDGPMAQRASHDIDGLALGGALWPLGPRDQPPTPPMNLVGDYGGGAMFLVTGVLAALLERTSSDRGQVVSTSILEGVVGLMSIFYYGRSARGAFGPAESRSRAVHTSSPGEGGVTGHLPWYRAYETADEQFMAVGAVEEPFYREFVERLGFDPNDLPSRADPASAPELHERFAAAFRTRTRAEWEQVFADSDACVAPVLAPSEAPMHSHNVAAGLFVAEGQGWVPAPAPRFSRTPARRTECDDVNAGVARARAWAVDPEHLDAIQPAEPVSMSASIAAWTRSRGSDDER